MNGACLNQNGLRTKQLILGTILGSGLFGLGRGRNSGTCTLVDRMFLGLSLSGVAVLGFRKLRILNGLLGLQYILKPSVIVAGLEVEVIIPNLGLLRILLVPRTFGAGLVILRRTTVRKSSSLGLAVVCLKSKWKAGLRIVKYSLRSVYRQVQAGVCVCIWSDPSLHHYSLG